MGVSSCCDTRPLWICCEPRSQLMWSSFQKMDFSLRLLSFLLLTKLSLVSGALPILCWHGVNDNANSCNGPINAAREEIPDVYAVKVQIGEDLAMDEANSILMRANDQVAYVCDVIANDPLLAGGYNGLGISLGAYEPWIQDLVAPAQYWHDPF